MGFPEAVPLLLEAGRGSTTDSDPDGAQGTALGTGKGSLCKVSVAITCHHIKVGEKVEAA